MDSLNKQSSSPKSFIIQSTDSSNYCPVPALIDDFKVQPSHKAPLFQATNGPSVKLGNHTHISYACVLVSSPFLVCWGAQCVASLGGVSYARPQHFGGSPACEIN